MSGKTIIPVKRGQTPTLLQAEKANELIKIVNALQNIRIEVGDYNNVIYGETSVIIQLKKIDLKELVRETPEGEFPLVAEYPLKIKEIENGKFKIFLDGFTKTVVYCTSTGRKWARFFLMKRDYNSNNVT